MSGQWEKHMNLHFLFYFGSEKSYQVLAHAHIHPCSFFQTWNRMENVDLGVLLIDRNNSIAGTVQWANKV